MGQNVWFMIKLAWTSGEKKVLVLGLLSALLAVALNLINLYITPTILSAVERHVEVDSAVRGRSLGRRLVEFAIERAQEMGGTLMLTSKPARVAANALYRSAGFEIKETNVYKMNL